MIVSFTLWQRINLDNLIRARKVVDGKDYITLFKVWEKFTVPDEERDEYIVQHCPTCGTPSRFDTKKVDDAEPLEFELESAEARELTSALKDFKPSVVDGKWWIPVKATLIEVGGDPSVKAPAADRKQRPQ